MQHERCDVSTNMNTSKNLFPEFVRYILFFICFFLQMPTKLGLVKYMLQSVDHFYYRHLYVGA